jgi:hypothetical protein
MSRILFHSLAIGLIALAFPGRPLQAQSLPLVETVEAQPLLAQVRRVAEALEYLGTPLPPATREALAKAEQEGDDARAVRAVQEALDPHCLLALTIREGVPLQTTLGPAPRELVQGGWRSFLVKVQNEAALVVEPRGASRNARPLAGSPPEELAERWLDIQMFNGPPLDRRLSGLRLEYRILQLYSREAGTRTANIVLQAGGLAAPGIDVTFNAVGANALTFRVLDENGRPTTASFLIRDRQGNIYPSPTKRLAPDFAFHPQVYRADGEKEVLPPGDYTIEYGRGPEYLTRSRTFSMRAAPQSLTFNLERWVDPSILGWWSGDHHIHAAGCAHYTNPTQGVHPPDIIRHCLGEDLKVGCALTWGPGFDYQKQFFTGAVDAVSRFPYLLRYDIEVSGFGSHQSGHLCLLRLKEQHYPGGDSTRHWPRLGLNTLKWAKRQGAVCGPAHSGWGLQVRIADLTLPNYLIPPFNDTGANEYIVDVTHEVPGPDGNLVPAVDFISTADTPYPFELNIWYHTLNCGFRPRAAGETDFPCITDDRVGGGRSYVKLDGTLDFDQWCEGIRLGRSYVGDGRSHLMEFRVNDVAVGEAGSELRLPEPGTVRATARVAALLPEQPDLTIRGRRINETPYWHLERARLGETREVPVEVIVNGFPVAQTKIVADGTTREVSFDVPIARSSWVALRLLPSSHTNPVFVLVGDKPIRASRRSAEWCLQSVDRCWSQKERFYIGAEREEARAAYEHARAAYRRILSESEAE